MLLEQIELLAVGTHCIANADQPISDWFNQRWCDKGWINNWHDYASGKMWLYSYQELSDDLIIKSN